MELTFLRGTSRLFNGTFNTPAGPLDENGVESAPPRPMYRVFTTRRWRWQPVRTTITFIGSENPEEHREVAQILWSWPSQSRSYVVRQGRVYSLNEFLGSKGRLNTDSIMTLGGEDYTWRTHLWEPQCYDSKDKQVVSYQRHYFKTHPRRQGLLKFSPEIAEHPDKLDAMLIGFWLFKVCRDVHFPWKRKYVPRLLGAAGGKVNSSETIVEPTLPEGVVVGDFCESKYKSEPESEGKVEPDSEICCGCFGSHAHDANGQLTNESKKSEGDVAQPEPKGEGEKPETSV